MKRTFLFVSLLCSSVAIAGDPTAHASAMVQAARLVTLQPMFARGVGAPVVNGAYTQGQFLIPQGEDEELACTYSTGTTACTQDDLNGKSINEPDHWGCVNLDQSPFISLLNLRLDWGEALVAGIAARFKDQAALACNYNHFASNPKLGSEYEALAAEGFTQLNAAAVLLEIIVGLRGCNQDAWNKYYSEIVHSLHYAQDMQCEDHALGNAVCGTDSTSVPTESYDQSFSFAGMETCNGFLTQAIAGASGVNPTVACDEVLVHQVGNVSEPNLTLVGMKVLCDVGLSLACMGLERTFRHHCELPDTPKSLHCGGLAGDHSTAQSANYCEGELYAGIGQNFMVPATLISTAELEVAMLLWTAVCKEPDSPCDADQCDTWCQRQAQPGGSAYGYCVSSGSDGTCSSGTCQCASDGECGGEGQPCCNGSCTRASDTCDATQHCNSSSNAATCGAAPLPPPHRGVSQGDPHLLTFDGLRYDLQAVGELTLLKDPTDNAEVQVRTQQWGNRNVAINVGVAARVGTQIVAFYSGGTVRLNHVVTQFVGGRTALGTAGAAIYRYGTFYVVIWPDGSQLQVSLSSQYISNTFYAANGRQTHLTGLLGNFDGNAANDLTTRTGTALSAPLSFTSLYGTYAESWRITQAASLFDYGAGQNTETFTNRAFPTRPATPNDLSQLERSTALAICQAAGVPAEWLDACVLDVALTGDASLATLFAHTPIGSQSLTVLPPDGGSGNVPGLFATGVDDSGVALALGKPDPHYTLLSPAQSAVVISNTYSGWVPNTLSHRWIWQNANAGPTGVTRTIRINFFLDGMDPTTASINGTWAADNYVTSVALNGHVITGLNLVGGPNGIRWNVLVPFAIPAGNPYFVQGPNTLDFNVQDVGGYAGFMIGNLSGSANPVTP